MNLKSVPVTKLLGITALVVVFLAAWLLLLGPTVSRLGEVDQRMTDAQDRNSTMALQLAQLQSQAADLPATRTRADRLAEVFPPTADQPGFFDQVTDAAADAGISADGITDISHGEAVVPGDAVPGTPDAQGSDALPETPVDSTVALQPVTVTVTGSYRDLTVLLGNLESMRRTLFVTSVEVAAAPQSEDSTVKGGMTLAVTGITFVAPPLEAPEIQQASSVEGAGGDGAGTDQASG